MASKQFLDGRQASGDIARLKGYRFVNASEAPENMSFNSNLLKRLTGRDTISARELYQRGFDFIPTFKLFFNTNHLPLIGDNTMFTSNRVTVIKFNRHFSEKEQNKNLKDELKCPDAMNEMFNWCIEGLKKFYEDGAIPPKSVLNDTEEYKSLNDKFELFISECLVYTKNNSSIKTVYNIYRNWLEKNGYPIESKQQFISHVKTKNIFAGHGTVKGKTVRNIIVGYTIENAI